MTAMGWGRAAWCTKHDMILCCFMTSVCHGLVATRAIIGQAAETLAARERLLNTTIDVCCQTCCPVPVLPLDCLLRLPAAKVVCRPPQAPFLYWMQGNCKAEAQIWQSNLADLDGQFTDRCSPRSLMVHPSQAQHAKLEANGKLESGRCLASDIGPQGAP